MIVKFTQNFFDYIIIFKYIGKNRNWFDVVRKFATLTAKGSAARRIFCCYLRDEFFRFFPILPFKRQKKICLHD